MSLNSFELIILINAVMSNTAFARVFKCETEEKQHNGITCDLLTAEVIRVVYSLYED